MRKIFILIIVLIVGKYAISQSISVSYFFPKNGYFANPIAPTGFSVPIRFTKHFNLTFGSVLHNVGGLSVGGFSSSYNSELPLVGPLQAFEIKLVPTLSIPTGNRIKFDFQVGGFIFTGFNLKLLEANIDKMIIDAHNFSAINSNLDFNIGMPGSGLLYAFRFNFAVSNSIWAYIGLSYLVGNQKIDIHGDFIGFDENYSYLGSREVKFDDKKMLYEGVSLSIGVSL